MVTVSAGAGGTPGAGRPPDAGGLVGREQEVAELCRLAGRTRMLTICGAAGTGKTRLLRALLPALAPGHPDGTHVVNLDDLRQPGLLAARVAAVLGVSPEPGVPVADTLAFALRGRRLVLGLDGSDHLPGACASLGARLLASAPDLLLVTASRRPLGVAAETVWPVPPLSLPAPGAGLAAASRSDAVRLFACRAAVAEPGFALDAANCADVAGICRTLGGVPLAIELVAARAADASPAGLAAALAAAAPQGATLAAAIGWSHDRLDPAEQVLLRRLSVFVGWSLEMAERVCADDGLPAARVHGLLAGLTRASLVQPDRRGHGRYRLTAAIRDYAAARLAEAGESELLRRRLRDFVAAQVEYLTTIGKARVPLTWPSFWELFASYQADSRNVRAVLGWCLEHGDAELGLRICTELGICWMAASQYDEGDRWLGAFLDAGGPAAPAAVRGPALAVRAQIAIFGGRAAGARAWAGAGLELCREAGDAHYTVIALNALSQAELSAGNAAQAADLAQDALGQARRNGDKWNEVYALNNAAAALAAADELAEARDSGEAALALALETGQHFGAALARLELGEVTMALGDLDAARGYLEALLPFARQAMPRPDTVRCLAGLGAIAAELGQFGQARAYLAEGLELSLRAGQRPGMAGGLLAFADLAARQGRPRRALRLAAAAAALCEAADLPAPDKDQLQQYRDAVPGGRAEADWLWGAGRELTSSAAVALALSQANQPGESGAY